MTVWKNGGNINFLIGLYERSSGMAESTFFYRGRLIEVMTSLFLPLSQRKKRAREK
jgi:hypothetical protein